MSEMRWVSETSRHLYRSVLASKFTLALLALVLVYGVVLAQGSALRLVVNYFITCVLVIGLQIFVGNSGIVSWGHSAFVGVGAYVTAWLTVPMVIKEDIFPGMPAWLLEVELGFVLPIVAAAVVATILAAIIGLVICRMKETAMAMSTLALLVIAHSVYNNWSGMTRGSEGVYGLPQNTTLWTAAAFAAASVVLAMAFKNSRTGLQVQSSREDPLAAEATGVNVVRVRYVAWVLSAAVSGVAGSIWAQYNLGFASPQFYYSQVFALLAMLVVGGMSNVSGAVVGAGAVTLLNEVLRRVENDGSLFGLQVPRISGLAQMVVAVVILFILIYRPSGILGWRELDGWIGKLIARRRMKRVARPDNPQLGKEG